MGWRLKYYDLDMITKRINLWYNHVKDDFDKDKLKEACKTLLKILNASTDYEMDLSHITKDEEFKKIIKCYIAFKGCPECGCWNHNVERKTKTMTYKSCKHCNFKYV